MPIHLPKDFPQGCIFIVDGLSAAFTIALLAAGHSIRCIYECKKTEWRSVNFVSLYDLLLSNVDIVEKRIETVPHPYFLHGNGILATIRNQKAFIRTLRTQVTLDPRHTYVGCATSSILLANKSRVRHILLDEGMDSLMFRHRLYSRNKHTLRDKLRGFIATRIIPFRFSPKTPQITMANDEHPAIVRRENYRNFRSDEFTKLIAPLMLRLNNSSTNVLTLIKGPSHTSARSYAGSRKAYAPYVDFNLKTIIQFRMKMKIAKDARFFLKSHPSLGLNSLLLSALVEELTANGIHAASLWEGINFDEQPSIPAEAYLSTGKFQYLLSLDASSTLWHVGQDQSVRCYMPLDSILESADALGDSTLLPLFESQPALNALTGGHVTFY